MSYLRTLSQSISTFSLLPFCERRKWRPFSQYVCPNNTLSKSMFFKYLLFLNVMFKDGTTGCVFIGPSDSHNSLEQCLVVQY